MISELSNKTKKKTSLFIPHRDSKVGKVKFFIIIIFEISWFKIEKSIVNRSQIFFYFYSSFVFIYFRIIGIQKIIKNALYLQIVHKYQSQIC